MTDYFKYITGKTFKEYTRRPSFDETIKKHLTKSEYPLRLLGTGEKEVYITEEGRSANFHILGEPGQGKSKFIEYNIRKDIDMGNGLCLLDPSDYGDTCKKILAYCAHKNIKKVVYIDPDTLIKYGKIATIKPLQRKYIKQSVEGVMEVTNILFNSKSTDTPRIKRNLSALLRLLAKNDLTLKESELFSEYQNVKRFSFIKDDRDSKTIKTLFQSPFNWQQYFSSTINRLDSFWEEPLSLMLGADTGIDFVRMVSEGWVILVNLFPGRNLTPVESQLLGVIVISQIIQAVDILKGHGWKGVHYLYIDEAGRFATPQIDTLLSYKRKSGLRLMLAHHYFDQFEDKKVMNSIKQGARIKVMFNTSSFQDRLEMIKDLGYGGDIPHLLATYTNQNLPQRSAIIKKNKESPVRVRIPDVPDAPPAPDKYIEEILNQDFYLTRDEINNQIDARKLRAYSKSLESRETYDGKTTDPPAVSKRSARTGISKSGKKSSDPPGNEPIKI